MESQRKILFKKEGMVEGEEEENMRHLCSLNFIVWVQRVAGGAEDWFSSMGLHAPGKRQFSQSSPLCHWLRSERPSAFEEEILVYQMEDVEKCWSKEDFLLGNSLIILHEVMIFETWLVTLVSIKY